MRRLALLAAALGIATFLVVGLLDKLPYSEFGTTITDDLKLPGALIARIFYPEGIHTAGGASWWASIGTLSNLIVYMLFSFICLTVVVRIRSLGRKELPRP